MRLLVVLSVAFAAAVLLAAGEEADLATSQGVKLTIRSTDPSIASADMRVSRLIALAVPEGEASSPFVPAGPFTATFEGFIDLKIRGTYTFTAHGRGELELTVNGEPVLSVAGDDLATSTSEFARLKKGPNHVVARYTSPAGGPAALRLYWNERGKPAEPIAPTVLTHAADDEELKRSLQLRAGRELVATLRCVKCHEFTPAPGSQPMPELAADAPSLNDIGSRLTGEWIARWVNDPRSIRPDATMPRVFPGDTDESQDARARDVAAYLASLGASPPAAQFTPDEVHRGGWLFTGLGCVACHTVGGGDAKRVTLASVKSKWRPASLVEYLRGPQRHYAWTRMPDFGLTEDEARQLAAFLLDRTDDGKPQPPIDLSGADVDRGRTLVATSGCLNCHTLDDATPELRARPLERAMTNLTGGCLAAEPGARGDAPDFQLDDPQRDAIRAFAAGHLGALLRDSSREFADRQTRQLDCNACHTIDSQIDRWSNLEAEIDAIQSALPPADDQVTGDQLRPSLTWVGEKLRPPWMERLVSGQVEYKPRPWLVARMPAFPSRAMLLAEGMPLVHGLLPSGEDEGPIDEELAEIGRQLVGREKGFACTTCHAIGSAAATSPFEAHGPNFMYTAERYRKDFYHRWVRDPQRYEPGTRMPQYADTEGKTALRDVLGGDASKQFEAIWQYLRKGDQMPAAQ